MILIRRRFALAALFASAAIFGPADSGLQLVGTYVPYLDASGQALARAVARHPRPVHPIARPPVHHRPIHRPVHPIARPPVVVRPIRPIPVVRPWYWGSFVAGVTIGSIIATTTVPPPPSPELCWYWTNSKKTSGYWDYCTPPVR